MPVAYGLCELAAWYAGENQKEEMYRKKSLEAAAAISKIFERDFTDIADLKEMLEGFGLTA